MREIDRQLFVASREGDSDAIRTLVGDGADPNVCDPTDVDHGSFLVNLTPLMVAAGSPRSSVTAVRALLDSGADIRQKSAGGVSAVWYASGGLGFKQGQYDGLEPDHPYQNWGGGDAQRLRLLLDAGGDPHEVASNSRSCVSEAAAAGDPNRLRLLISRGASAAPHTTGQRPWDPNGPLGMLDSLVEAGMTFFSDHTPVPLFEASSSGSLECVEIILETGFLASFELSDDNALSFASTREIAELLWLKGARPKARVFGGAMTSALENKRFGVADFLFGTLSPEIRTKALNTQLLHYAGVAMDDDVVQWLLDGGANAKHFDDGLGTPLHYACWQGDGNGGRENSVVERTLTLLCDAGADINLNLPRRGTPLHEAVSGDWDSPTSTRFLVMRGAKFDQLNDEGLNPFSAAIRFHSYESALILLAAGSMTHREDLAVLRQAANAKPVDLKFLDSINAAAYKMFRIPKEVREQLQKDQHDRIERSKQRDQVLIQELIRTIEGRDKNH